MREFIRHFAIILFHLGGPGLIILGVFDSSFLMLPLGNDLLVIALTARKHALMPYYAMMATIGSVGGCFITDWISRKGGEKGLEQRLPRKRFAYVKRKVDKRAGWAVGIAALLPPPFPFTTVVAAAAAFEYPRKKLLAIIAVTRFMRFSIEGALAIAFGRHILRWAKSTALEYAMLALVAIALAASAYSIYTWTKQSARATRAGVRSEENTKNIKKHLTAEAQRRREDKNK